MEDRNNGNQRMEITVEVTRVETPRLVESRLHAPGGFDGTVDYTLDELSADRTRLTYTATYRYAKVMGIGGVFFKAKDPETLRAWYRTHLGIDVQPWGGTAFRWREMEMPDRDDATVWSIFPDSSLRVSSSASRATDPG